MLNVRVVHGALRHALASVEVVRDVAAVRAVLDAAVHSAAILDILLSVFATAHALQLLLVYGCIVDVKHTLATVLRAKVVVGVVKRLLNRIWHAIVARGV